MTGVLVVARSTNGYFYGMTASLIAAVVVNYAFMEPYYRFELRGLVTHSHLSHCLVSLS